MTSRVTSELHVSSIIRQVNISGGFAAVLRRGASDAGAIFICVSGRGGGSALYGQVPQSLMMDRPDPPAGGRLFELLESDVGDADLQSRFEKEARLDPDFWVLEIEPNGPPGDYFDIA